jgi:hypothetical protein
MTFHSQLNGKSSSSHVPITTNITKQILCFMDSNYNGISITNIIRSSIPMYSSGCVWQWAAPPSDIQQEWFGSFYLLRRSLFNAYGDHRSLEEIHGNSNRWPQEHLKCGAVLGIQPFTAWGVKEICCLRQPVFCSPMFPVSKSQPTNLSQLGSQRVLCQTWGVSSTDQNDQPSGRTHHGARGKCGRPVSAIVPLQATIG